MKAMDIHSPIAVPFGHSRDFDVAGRDVTVTRTEQGLYLILEGSRAAVIHPQPNGHYIVTGPGESDPRSEPLDYEAAVALSLTRLRQQPSEQ